jgi:hypothetical protein
VNIGSLHDLGTTAINTGSITTATTQTYDNAVTLGADTALSGTSVSFNGTVSGNKALTINAPATFNDTASVGSLHDLGTTAINTGSITTATTQTYDNAVTLGADTTLTASSVTFNSAVGGNQALTIDGAVNFNNTVSIGSLHDLGTTTINTGSITTATTQAYDNAVTLGSDATLTGSSVTFGGTVGGNQALTIDAPATFNDTVSVGALHDLGATAINTSAITTATTQTYDNAVTLGADTTLSSTSVNFNGTVGGSQALTINAPATFSDTVNIGSLHDLGTTAINTGSITTTTTQTYDGTATLGADTTLTGSTVTFNGTVGGNKALTIDAAATFNDTVSVSSLHDLGTTAINTGSITTTTTQTYDGTATLGADTTLTGSTVTFNGTVGGNKALMIDAVATFNDTVSVGSLHDLGTTAINTGSITTATTQTYDGTATLGADATLTGSTVTFNGTVGGNNALTIGGVATFNDTVSVGSLHDLGTTAINTGSITTASTQTYDGAVTLTGATTLNSTGLTTSGLAAAGNALTIEGGGTDSIGSATGISTLSLNKSGGAISFQGHLDATTLTTSNNNFNVSFNAGTGGSTTSIQTATFSGTAGTGTITTGNEATDTATFANGLNTTKFGATALGGTVQNTATGATFEFGTINSTGAPVTVHSQGSVTFNGAATVGGALTVDTVDGSITTVSSTSQPVTTTAGDVSFTANSNGSTAAVTIGAGGIQSAGGLSIKSADTLTIGSGNGVVAGDGSVTLVAGKAAGMTASGSGVTPALVPANYPGSFKLASMVIDGLIRASGSATHDITLYSTGPMIQNTATDAGIQNVDGNLIARTFNDGAQAAPISLLNNLGTGSGICGAIAGTGNCAGPLLLETRTASGANFAASNIAYDSINGTTISGIGTAADIIFQAPSFDILTGSVNGRNVYFYAYGTNPTAEDGNGHIKLGVQFTNNSINNGQPGGSLNLIADGDITIDGTNTPENTVIGSRVTDALGNVTVGKFNHDLKLVASNNIDITGSIYMTGTLNLRADASGPEVQTLAHLVVPTPPVAPGNGVGSVSITVPDGRQFPVEVIADTINVGAPGAPVQNVTLQALPTGALTQVGGGTSIKSADATLSATGDVNIYYNGAMSMLAGTVSAPTTGAGDNIGLSANAQIVADRINILGTGGAGNDLFMHAGNAAAASTAGGIAFARADAVMLSTTSKQISIGGSMVMQGGTSTLASQTSAIALIDPTDLDITVGGNLVLQSGIGPVSDARIINQGNIRLIVPGGAPYFYTMTGGGTVAASGLVIIGGPNSGLFGANGKPINLGDEIKLNGGAGSYTRITDPGLVSTATIEANSPRSYEQLLNYIIFAANEETRSAAIRGLFTTDDTDLPPCN